MRSWRWSRDSFRGEVRLITRCSSTRLKNLNPRELSRWLKSGGSCIQKCVYKKYPNSFLCRTSVSSLRNFRNGTLELLRKNASVQKKDAKDELHFSKFRVSNLEALTSMALVPSFRMYNVGFQICNARWKSFWSASFRWMYVTVRLSKLHWTLLHSSKSKLLSQILLVYQAIFKYIFH